jgi:glycerol-3-phosphate dehydrogenase
VYDVAIIGGGCNGTALARDLALRGLTVCLFEKSDLGAGATGASSAMIHGGARYLLHDIHTTEHSCEDSGYIQKIAPHILARVPFLIPVAKGGTFGPLSLRLTDVYFDVYDRYSPLKNGLPHARLTCEEMQRMEPGLTGDFLGGITMDEWATDPVRLCLLNALDAAAHGAQIHTYTEVVDFLREDGRIAGVRTRGAGQAAVSETRARFVVNCGGPWAERLAGLAGARAPLRPGKGVHLVYEKRLTNFAIVTEAIDGRQVFMMPYQNETWIGTTDDDYFGDLDDLWATQDEVQYLVGALARIVPSIARQRLIGTRVGVRNTIAGWGQMEDALSRRYEIVDHAGEGAPGLLSLLGGKLASFRVQAQDVADELCRRLAHPGRCQTHERRLPGGDTPPTLGELGAQYPAPRLALLRILARHGSDAHKVLDVGRDFASGYNVVCQCEPTLECEVRYAIRHEYVTRLGDLMTRCRVALGPCQGTCCGLRTAQIFAEERGLDATDERAALMDLLTRRWRSARPVLGDVQLAQVELLMNQYTGLWQRPEMVPLA